MSGTAQDRELIERFEKREHYFRNASEGEYDANLLRQARFALQSRIAEVEALTEALDDAAAALHSVMRDEYDAFYANVRAAYGKAVAALSLQRRV